MYIGSKLEFSIREKCLISFDSIGTDNAFMHFMQSLFNLKVECQSTRMGAIASGKIHKSAFRGSFPL